MTSPKVRNIITESGNSFHCRVATAIRQSGWTVSLSAYYVDAATDKAREIDIIAERLYPMPTRNMNQPPRALIVRLYIECKYTTQDTVFWFDQMDLDRAMASFNNRVFARDKLPYPATSLPAGSALGRKAVCY